MGALFKLLIRIGAAVASVAIVGGCAVTPDSSASRLLDRCALLDFNGLHSREQIGTIRSSIAYPVDWERLPTKRTALYVHEQWRSPSMHTGVGIALVHMPLPLGADAIAWFAKRQYSKQSDDGRIISEWTDDLGRDWFEVENDKYHVRGYVMTHGLDAWIVYSGYRRDRPFDAAEVALSLRSLQTIVPNAPEPVALSAAK